MDLGEVVLRLAVSQDRLRDIGLGMLKTWTIIDLAVVLGGSPLSQSTIMPKESTIAHKRFYSDRILI